jgi:serine/threonine protein phosphatase 1
MTERTYYAIGDVHGEIEKLEALLGSIRDDARRIGAAPTTVFLGDLIDRGPDSRAVVERALCLCEAGEALAIKGNHEELMLHAFEKWDTTGVHYWAENGGDETIAAYKRANGECGDWREAIDEHHIKWLDALPVMIRDEPRGLVFVHGGIDPWRFPNCSDEVKLWTRSPTFFREWKWPRRDELRDILVVHGHTPTDDFEPDHQPRRINVDTGACFGGPLTAVVLAPAVPPRFLHAR